MYDADVLVHYGIRGQKWGVRRKKSSQQARLDANKQKRNADLKFTKKNLRGMSDKALDHRINRLEREQRFKELYSKSKPGYQVKKFITNTLFNDKDSVFKKAVKIGSSKVVNMSLDKTLQQDYKDAQTIYKSSKKIKSSASNAAKHSSIDGDGYFLAHYGIAGMRWGIRRARKKNQPYNYRSWSTKRHTKKAERAYSKGKTKKALVEMAKADKSSEIDQGMQRQANSRGRTVKLVASLMGHPFQTKAYMTYRARGQGAIRSLLKTAALSEVGSAIGKHRDIKKAGKLTSNIYDNTLKEEAKYVRQRR
ncbi:MAG: hypothetical protein HUJ78_00090 [Mogibacterium sp.]|nr:hypothetical protein [Mogibacterium sp.]